MNEQTNHQTDMAQEQLCKQTGRVTEHAFKDNNLSEQTDRQTEAVIEQLWKVANRVIDRQTGRVIELTTQEMERNEQSDQQTSAPIELATNVQKNKHKLQPGQQSVKSYFKVTARPESKVDYIEPEEERNLRNLRK